MTEAFTTIEFLTWVVYAGGAFLAASWILDQIPAVAKWTSGARLWANRILTVGLALGAYAALQYLPAEFIQAIDPWLKVASGTWILYSGQQIVHKISKQ